MIKTIIFRNWYYENIRRLPAEKRLEAYDAILSMAFHGVTPDVSPEIEFFVSSICNDLEFSLARYNAKKAEKGLV